MGNEDISSLIRELRTGLELSQEKFAARIGVSFPTVNRWENGRVNPSQLAVQRIKEFLKTLGPKGVKLLKRHFPKEL